MMGQEGGAQDRLFYSLDLSDHVPSDDVLRGIDSLSRPQRTQHLAPFHSHTGRPSIDPELMVRVLVIGYCIGVRSERRLYEEVHLTLDHPIDDHAWGLRRREYFALRLDPVVAFVDLHQVAYPSCCIGCDCQK